MFSTRRLTRLKNDEHFPIVILALVIILVIHLCNKYDEKTANQFIMIDNEKQNGQTCPLYPSTLQGFQKKTTLFSFVDCIYSLICLDNSLVDMTTDIEWREIEQEINNVQKGRV